MTVSKVNGFDFPYRSQTFQGEVNELAQASGLLRMDGVIQTSGGNVIIPPFHVVQNGLLFSESTTRTIPLPSQNAPYFLTVSAATSAMVDDLAFRFPKAPVDITANQVIIGYWDGVEWRTPQLLSLQGINDDVNQANIDFKKVGPLSGLQTTYSAGNYDTGTGVIVDREGLRQSLDEDYIYPAREDDASFERVDRIVYRRPADSINRIGLRQFVLGGAHAAVATGVHATEYIPAVAALPRNNVKALVLSDNTAVALTSSGYADHYSLSFVKYTADRSTQTIAPITIIATMDNPQFAACVDSSNNTIVVYALGGNLYAAKFNSLGVQTVAPQKVYDAGSYIVSVPSVSYSAEQGGAGSTGAIFVSFSLLVAPGNNQIYFQSMSLGALSFDTITAAKQLLFISGNLAGSDIVITSDNTIFIAVHEAAFNRVAYREFDVIGNALAAAVTVSSATQKIGGGSLTDGAIQPRVLFSDNKTLFVTFLQQKAPGVYGLAVWTGGSAFMQQFTNANEDFTTYDVVLDDFLNGLHFLVSDERSGANAVRYFKMEGRVVQFVYAAYSSTANSVSTVRDRTGSMLHVWANPLSGSFTNYETSVALPAVGGPQPVPGPNTVEANQFLVASSISRQPANGDQVVVSGGAGNAGTYAILGSILKNVTGANSHYLVTVSTNFPAIDLWGSSTATGNLQEPSGNAARFVKTNSELTSLASRFDVLPTDILLARIVLPGPTILNYNDSGTGPVSSTADKLVVYGPTVIFDWEHTTAGALTITGGLHIADLVNDFDYSLTDGTFPLSEGEALYAVLNLTSPVTPLVAPIGLLPWNQPIQVIGVIKEGQFVPHALLAGAGLDELDPGEVSTLGEDLPDVIRARLGILSDTSYEAYTSTGVITTNDNYPEAISKLDAAVYAIQNDLPGEESYTVPGGGISTYTATTLTWDASNTHLDILVFVNGKKQTQDQTGTTLYDFKKTNVNVLAFTYTIPAGAELVIHKVRTGGGAVGFLVAKDEGSTVLPICQALNFLGAGITAVNAGGGQVNVTVPGAGAVTRLTKNYKNASGSTIAANKACAFDALGNIVLADANITALSDFAGITKNSINNGDFGELYKIGDCVGVIVGLGANPGDPVYLGETPGSLSLSPPAALTDTIIMLGRAEPEDGADPVVPAPNLYLSPQLISVGA